MDFSLGMEQEIRLLYLFAKEVGILIKDQVNFMDQENILLLHLIPRMVILLEVGLRF